MNLKQAKSLLRGTHVHYTGRHECSRTVGPRGRVTLKITNCRVSGEPQTWKRSPEKVKVPVKHGRYENAYITEENLQDWHLEIDCPALAQEEHPEGIEPIMEDGGMPHEVGIAST